MEKEKRLKKSPDFIPSRFRLMAEGIIPQKELRNLDENQIKIFLTESDWDKWPAEIFYLKKYVRKKKKCVGKYYKNCKAFNFYTFYSRAPITMDRPFVKSTGFAEKYNRLLDVVKTSDTLGILINADPDSMASAMALKRIFWKKARRVLVYRVNSIKRADNLAFVKSLAVDQKHIRYLKRSTIRKWALVDSQPHHHKLSMNHQFNIIIDHHPISESIKADFLDIEVY